MLPEPVATLVGGRRNGQSKAFAMVLGRGVLSHVLVDLEPSDGDPPVTVVSQPLPREAVVKLTASVTSGQEGRRWEFELAEDDTIVIDGGPEAATDPPCPGDAEKFARALAAELGWDTRPSDGAYFAFG
jgi:hypothetical protein